MFRRYLPILTSLALLLAGSLAPAAAQAQSEYPGLETGKMWTFDVAAARLLGQALRLQADHRSGSTTSASSPCATAAAARRRSCRPTGS